MKKSVGLFFLVMVFCLRAGLSSAQTNPKSSGDTEACLECHKKVSPGIVADWERSLHASTLPEEALKKEPKALRVSAQKFPGELDKTTVGCAECRHAEDLLLLSQRGMGQRLICPF